VILEIAQLQVRPGQNVEFEAAFSTAETIISSMPGYLGHELQKCIEQTGHYMLLVRWESVEHHETGFRKSAQYQEWRRLLHHFYDPFPVVLHYEHVAGKGFGSPRSDKGGDVA
jgi:heme-degrading monooxygenase HmoA